MAGERRRTWSEVFEAELQELGRRHEGGAEPDRARLGLAISGGGIRSATFALGVLESLKQKGLLDKLHYLSTVSGGGFIGSWLSANCVRNEGWLQPGAEWRRSIAHLRRYSNYLSPRVGFFSADTWSMLTIWFRNTLLIQTTVVLAIACALLVPRPLFEIFRHWPDAEYLRWATVALFILGVVGIAGNQLRLTTAGPTRLLRADSWPLALGAGALCIGAAWLYGWARAFDPFAGGEVRYIDAGPVALLLVLAGFVLQPAGVRLVALVWPNDDPPQQINYTQNWVQGVVVVPLIIAGYLMAAVLWGEANAHVDRNGLHTFVSYGGLLTGAWRYWPFPLAVVFASFWLLSFCAIDRRRDTAGIATAFGVPFVAVPVFHAVLCAVMLLFLSWAKDPGAGTWKAFVWGPPLVALAFVLAIVVMIGMMARQSTDDVREWWSRLGAWLGIYATAWLVIAVSAVYAGGVVTWLLSFGWWTQMSAGGGWLATVAGGLFAGRSETTDGAKPGKTRSAKDILAAVAPFVFIAGVFVAVSYGLERTIRLNAADLSWANIGVGSHGEHAAFLSVSLATLAGCLVGLLLLAWRVDINLFSLNSFYRNRLVRCYLGATRFRPGQRNPQLFTGFDEGDDMRLADLAPEGRPAVRSPLHIVNCALNLGGSGDLALHTRHSAAFTLTPLHCGSAYLSRDQNGEARELGFIRTSEFGGALGAPTLGQAVAVSGAAASPNMGYHTSPVTAFLLTLFNVRLGWWFPNPAKTGAELPSPPFSLSYLLAELFGGATDKSRFVMISDGGHFENLAAYELIRRRCRVVIVSDGECDPKLQFDGLGTLIRMCEVDFGVRITIDVGQIRPSDSQAWSSRHWAIGTIDYPDAPSGTLIYLKASMTGREATPVRQYKASHPTFPHETTGDQFYGEDQFESYRTLGREVGRDAFDSLNNPDELVAVVIGLR